MTVIVEVEAGVCGFHTSIEAKSEDTRNVTFCIQSNCEKIQGLAERLDTLGPIDAYMEINPAAQSQIMNTVREALLGCCAGCAVPVGIFKGMQVAAGLALPRDIAISITKENQ